MKRRALLTSLAAAATVAAQPLRPQPKTWKPKLGILGKFSEANIEFAKKEGFNSIGLWAEPRRALEVTAGEQSTKLNEIQRLEGGHRRVWRRRAGRPPSSSRSPRSRARAITSSPARSSTAAPARCSTCTLRRLRHRHDLRGERRPGRLRRRGSAEHESDLHRGDRQPFGRDRRSRSASPTWRTRVDLPLVVDATLATPYLCRPMEHGRRHRGALGDEVHRRPRHVDRRRRRRVRPLRRGTTAASRR